jgi:hypothetical protein
MNIHLYNYTSYFGATKIGYQGFDSSMKSQFIPTMGSFSPYLDFGGGP